MTETWHQAVCRECDHRYDPKPAESEWAARDDRDFHNETNHDGDDVAVVREFEAEAMGSTRSRGPREQPPVEEEVES